MRIALLGMAHETNTFSQVPATYQEFQQAGFVRGQELVDEYQNSFHTNAGFLQAEEEFGCQVVPLLYTHAGPIGTITKDAFDRIVGEMLQLLGDQRPWDGVFLSQHGAAVSEEYPDADGEVCRRVRELVGPDVPIGMNLDLHANVSQMMIDNTTVTTFYRTNPHLDAKERALHCADLIVRTIIGEITPVQALEMPPVVINIVKQFTGEKPMLGVMRDASETEARPGILSTSVAEGYPYADVEEMGMSFLAIADGDPQAATKAAKWMARRAWDCRAHFVVDTPSPREALEQAVATVGKPVVLMDVGDNIGAGSSADSTVILAEAQRMGIRGLLQTLYDPEAVQVCITAGTGPEITLMVGAKTDDMHGVPVEVTGTVRLISNGKFEDPEPTHGGWRYYDGGPTVVLDTTDGYTLVLNSKRVGNTSRQQMYALGIRPEEMDVIVAKGVVSPRPAYEPIAYRIILVNSPGVTTSDLSTFQYVRRRVPLYPFEAETGYP